MASTREQRAGRQARGRSCPSSGAGRGTRARRPGQARPRAGGAPSRGKALRRRSVAVLVVLTVLGLGYVVLFTSLLGVDSVRVKGAHSVPAERVRGAASVEQGTPLLRVDTAAVRERVGELPALSSIEVSRSWPSTIVISVTERTPVAALDAAHGYRLVDSAGVAFRTVPEKPKGLPELTLPPGGGQDQARRAAAAVVAALPDQLRGRVATVRARGEHIVHLTLDDGTRVIWGSAERSRRKARVLAALMTRPGSVYDVSSPEIPTVR